MNATQPDGLVLNEARFRLDLSHFGERSDFFFKGDFIADEAADGIIIDLRQAMISLRASNWLDVRAGRQVSTWGTGDLLFVNDLFPKDFVSFFVGRDDEFLKAPANSAKLTIYNKISNLDFVWTPVFAPDRFITGERLSFFDPTVAGLVGRSNMPQPLTSLRPLKTLKNGEFAGRLFRTLGGYEIAVYGYAGFFKQPRAFDPISGSPTHSRLTVFGASWRGNFLGGISNVEGAYYNSRDDDRGANPYVPNSQWRGLAGHEREIFANVNLGMQYYVEQIQHHDNLLAHSPAPQFEPEEFRHLVTTRLTGRLSQETLTLSLFAFLTPGQYDMHYRPTLSWKWSDTVTLAAGANIMLGEEHAFFGQLENNSNIYARIRYGF